MKKILILSIILLFVFTTASVCASDINETETIGEELVHEDIMPFTDTLSYSNDFNNVSQVDDSLKANTYNSFTALQDDINNAKEGSVIKVNGNYLFEDITINITKSITIEGNNLVIDGNRHNLFNSDYNPVFNITSNNVVLKNIKFISCSKPVVGKCNNLCIANCDFLDSNVAVNIKGTENCLTDLQFVGNGKALIIEGNNNIIKNSLFENNSAAKEGAAIYFSSSNSLITNCNFINNYVKDWHGGAIYCWSSSRNSNITYCNFFNNDASLSEGGAIYIGTSRILIDHCNFRNNTSYGGNSISSHGEYTYIFNSNFAEDVGISGVSTLYLLSSNAYVDKCTFNNNTHGSFMLIRGANTIVSNSTFSNNEYYLYPSAFTWFGNNGLLTNCSFINLFSLYGAVYFGANGCKMNNCIFDMDDLMLTYHCNLDYNNNYWGNNFYNEQAIINKKIISYYDIEVKDDDMEYKSPNSWVNLNIEGDSNIQILNSKEYKISFVHNNGSLLKYSLPKYKIKVKGTNLKESYLYITNNIKKIKYVGSIVGNNYIYCLNNDNKIILSKNILVKKATPKITAKAQTFKKAVKIKKYSITLKDNLNKVMKNTKVTIKVNKVSYSAKTNSKGVATFKINKLTKKGTFKSVITYSGNKYYNKVTKTINIKVK